MILATGYKYFLPLSDLFIFSYLICFNILKYHIFDVMTIHFIHAVREKIYHATHLDLRGGNI